MDHKTDSTSHLLTRSFLPASRVNWVRKGVKTFQYHLWHWPREIRLPLKNSMWINSRSSQTTSFPIRFWPYSFWGAMRKGALGPWPWWGSVSKGHQDSYWERRCFRGVGFSLDEITGTYLHQWSGELGTLIKLDLRGLTFHIACKIMWRMVYAFCFPDCLSQHHPATVLPRCVLWGAGQAGVQLVQMWLSIWRQA